MVYLNRIIQTLILSNFLLQSAWGLIGPIFAIFITQHIQGGNLISIGFINASYWLIKSITQPFIARFLDSKKGEIDDFVFLVLGLFLTSLIPLGYFISNQVWQIFLLEMIRGLCMACVVPTWSAMFTRHVEKGKEAFSWSIESTSIGFALGFSAAFGSIVVSILGFRLIFILVSLFGLASSFSLFSIRKQIISENHLT